MAILDLRELNAVSCGEFQVGPPQVHVASSQRANACCLEGLVLPKQPVPLGDSNTDLTS